LLIMAENNPDIIITPIKYMNSGDTDYGDKTQVVGYYSLAFSLKSIDIKTSKVFETFEVYTDKDKKDLLHVARETLNKYIKEQKVPDFSKNDFTDNIKKESGVFVTLTKDGKLRGCIGQFSPDKALYVVVQDMAIAAAIEDKRFEPVTNEELNQIEIEISVLSPMRKISSIDEIQMGKHGIYIRKGVYSGTFLPQVGTETKWTKEEFLGHCARDKAGIGWEGWKDAEIYIYEACLFEERMEN
jgi:MEMO1 family protein